jgi:PsbP-like protein
MSISRAKNNIGFVLVILSVLSLKQQILFAQTQSGFSVYENKTYDFEMEYPSDWKQASPSSPAYVVTFKAPTDKQNITNPSLIEGLFLGTKSSLEIAPQISVSYQNLSIGDNNSRDVKTYANKILDQLRSLPATTIFEELENTTLSGNSAYKIVFTSTDPLGISGKFKQMSIYTIVNNNNKAFELSYSAKADAYDRYLPLFEHTIESFKFTK